MSGNLPTCTVCEKEPLRDNAVLCHPCTRHLERDLGDVPALLAEVETTHLRQSRTGGARIGGARSSERPLPYDERPDIAARALREVLIRWAVHVMEHRAGRAPSDRPDRLACYLQGQVDWLRLRDEAPLAKQQLEGAISRLRFTIDRSMLRAYIGTCNSVDYLPDGEPDPASEPCPAELYARPKQTSVTCPECQTTHDVKDRREWLLELVDDQLDYPANLARALSSLGMPVPEATIRSWVARKRLVSRGEDDRGRCLYRVGDVRELVTAEAMRQQDRVAGNRRTA